MENVAQRVLSGDRLAAGRLMRWVDDDDPRARSVLDELHQASGNAFYLGITGNPGSGKSTLVDHLISNYRKRGLKVGCVAVDPTSPFSGGAILGDRVRMGKHGADRDVFIRSAATRGNLGGISRSTPMLMMVMDAMGFDVVIVETVGVGQSEVDIAGICDVNVVVVVPGLGDEIQAAKAGLYEIADVFAVNKSERDGADRLVLELKSMLALGTSDDVEIVKTVALNGTGIEDLVAKIDARNRTHPSRDIRRAKAMIRLSASHRFFALVAKYLEENPNVLQEVADRKASPFDIVDAILDR